MLEDINLSVYDQTQLLLVTRALNSPHRLNILTLIAKKSLNITDLAKELGRPLSSTHVDLNLLEEAGLIKMETVYTNTGKSTIAHRTFDQIVMTFCKHGEYTEDHTAYKFSLPIGSYVNALDIEAPCGMCGTESAIGNDNDDSIFYSPDRFKAELIWMTSGFLEYRIKKPADIKNAKAIEVSFETCSEAPLFNNDYKSDISLLINDFKIGEWLSLGDYGDMRGLLNPPFWPSEMTQHGILVNWRIDQTNTTINNAFASYARLENINLDAFPYISIKIGVDKNARHKGGINLFGEHFGNYPQNIIVKIKM